MKVNHPTDPLKFERSSIKSNGNGAAKSTAATGAGGETLSLSELSAQLHKLETQLASGEEFDASRVATIKEAIRDGQFKINSGAVADKLIKTAKELLGK
jgi:negative regulator of flagellin synthesis FlgM